MKTILHLCADIGSDTLPYKKSGYNVIYVGKEIGVENYHPPINVYGIIANPPCTMFSYARTNSKQPRDLRNAMNIVYHCLRIIWECQYDVPGNRKVTPLKFWMLENPFGLLRSFLGKPALIYSPYEYGDTYQKKTCAWGNFNIPIKIKNYVKPITKFDLLKSKEINYVGNEHMSRQERRSICSSKFAEAFFKANQ